MNGLLPDLIVILPFMAAAAVALIPSWRIGAWTAAASTTLSFLLSCALAWHRAAIPPLAAGVAQVHLVLLTSLIAMIASWYARRDIVLALTARRLDRRRVRWCQAAFQLLLGGILLAVLADVPALTWLGLVVGAAAAPEAAGAPRERLVASCGAGLMLALFGAALQGAASGFAGLFLLVGYGALAGLVPLHAWLRDVAEGSFPPGATLTITTLVNAPFLVFARLPAGLLIVGGLALLVGAVLLASAGDLRRAVAFAGTAQLGMAVFAFGIGSASAGWLHITLLALIRAAALEGHGAPVAQSAAILALALLPLFMLVPLAGPTVGYDQWLLLPLAGGALLATRSLLALPRTGSARSRGGSLWPVPVWLQLGLAALLAFAMPAPVADWFRALAAAG